MSGQLNYNERYAILSARVAFAEYSQRKKLANEGRITSLNIFPPNHDASIMTRMRIGELNTTGEELANYLSAVDLPATTSPITIPDPPVSLCVITSDSALTIIFLPGSDGGSPITNYSYSTDGVVFTELSPADTASPLTISGLTNGTVYTIYIKAINSVGSSAASDAITASPIPSSFDPSSIAGLNVWLDAQNIDKVILTGEQVSAWNDSSSGANNFTAAGGVINYSQPSSINNRPAINFVDATPTSTYLVKSGFNITPSSNQLTLFIVLSQTGLGTGNSEIFYTKDNYSYFDLFNNTNPSQSGNLALDARSSLERDTGQDIITSPAINVIISVVLSTTNGSVYLNGTVTSINNTAITGLSLDGVHDWAISSGAFKGFVGEVITYPSALTTTNREKVEGYLAWKWGLQSQLPDTNPWKNTPPTGDTAPGAPTLVYILGGDTVAYVYYTAGTGTPTNYQYTVDTGTTYTTVNPVDTVTPAAISGLTNAVTKTVQLRAYNGGGYSSISNGVSVTPTASTAPAAWLLFDPNDSSCYSGSGSTVNNIGSYGALAGTITGSLSWITGTGISTKVFNLAGGYINFGQVNFTNTFSVTAWLYPTAKASINTILANGFANVNTAGFKFGWNSWNTSDNNMLFESGDGTAGNWQVPSSVNNIVTMNEWQHLSVIFNANNQFAIFLRNGVPVNVFGITTASNVSVNQTNFNIGAYLGGAYTMRAQLGLLKVFNSFLTASQVLDDFNNTKAAFGL